MSAEHALKRYIPESVINNRSTIGLITGLSLLTACWADYMITGDSPFISHQRSQKVVNPQNLNTELTPNQAFELVCLELGFLITGLSIHTKSPSSAPRRIA